jgi:phytol kinase
VIAALLVGTAFLAIFTLAELWRAYGKPPVEWTRKLVHFLGGLVTAAFPWLFESHWWVLLLGASFFLILWGTRRAGLLRSVHGVARRSEGGLYFPLAIYLLFLVGADQPVFYLISILVLVVSDAVAAVLGSAYGRASYLVELDTRTIEGSTVFFLATFLIAHLPLLLVAGFDPMVSVLVAAQLALIVTLLEGICVRGSDNIVVPLATFFTLLKLTKEPAWYLEYQFSVMMTIIVVIALITWRLRVVGASAAMALMLFFYGTFALGGREWITAPALALGAFVLFHVLRLRLTGRRFTSYQVVATFYIALAPIALVFANNVFETMVPHPGALGEGDPFFASFVGAVAAQIALILYHVEREASTDGRVPPSLAASVVVGAGVLVIPIGLGAGVRGISVAGLAVSSAVLVAAMLVHSLIRRSGRWPSHAPWIGRLQAACVLIAVAALLPWALPH